MQLMGAGIVDILAQAKALIQRGVLGTVMAATLILILPACSSDKKSAAAVTVPAISLPVDADTFRSINAGREITAIDFTNTGGDISSCASEPALPTGLVLEATSCRISGMTTEVSLRNQVYTIMATNAAGQASLRINLRVIDAGAEPPPPPAQELTIALSSDNPDPKPFNLPLNRPVLVTKAPRAISPNLQSGGILIANNSVIKIGLCAIEPALPSGLNLVTNPYYCLVEGAPNTIFGETTFTITATSLAPEPMPETPPDQQPTQEQNPAKNPALVTNPESEGGAGDEEPKVDPSRPAVTQTATVSFAIVVLNSVGVPQLADRGEVLIYVNSRANLPIMFDNIGEALDPSGTGGTGGTGGGTAEARCTIAPTQAGELDANALSELTAMPLLGQEWASSLTSDNSSCQLDITQSGTPVLPAAEDGTVPDRTSYPIRVAGLNASDRGNSARVLATIINATAPVVSTAPALANAFVTKTNEAGATTQETNITLMQNVTLDDTSPTNKPVQLVNSGGSALSCRVVRTKEEPVLPTGLELRVAEVNGNTSCVITGTPTQVRIQFEQYTIEAQNSVGTSTATASINVIPVSPAFVNEIEITSVGPPPIFTPNPAAEPVAVTAGAAVSIVLANNGGQASACLLRSQPGSNQTFTHRNYTAALGDEGTTCTVSGTAPNVTGEVLTQVLYVEISNRHNQESTYQLTIQVSP